MENSLVDAAQAGNIDALYGLIKQNPYLLENIDKIPFLDTPLHVASSSGSTHFAIEILSLKPSFGTKLNPDGFSPLDLALRSGQMETVHQLVDYDPELVRVKGKERITPLHFAAEVDNGSLLARFLLKCPKSIEDLTIRRETAVHVAVKNGSLGAFKVLLGWLQRTQNEGILNWEDEKGNTVLHVAASTNNFEVVRLLIRKVGINLMNKGGLTALDLAMQLPYESGGKTKKILRAAGAKSSSKLPKIDRMSELLSYKESSFRKRLFRQRDKIEGLEMSGETRGALLVVAVLIATATYQAILSPPGGISSSGDNSAVILRDTSAINPPNSNDPGNNGISNIGKVQMDWHNYYIFLILNTVPFFASLGMIVALLPKTNYNSLLVVPLLSLLLSYGFSAAIISPRIDALLGFFYASISFGVFVLTARSTSVKYQVLPQVDLN